MTFPLPLPAHLDPSVWRVKIRDRERLEPPHVSIIRKGGILYRWGLRDCAFIRDRDTNPRDVPAELIAHLMENLARLRSEWDARYPENPVGPVEDCHE